MSDQIADNEDVKIVRREIKQDPLRVDFTVSFGGWKLQHLLNEMVKNRFLFQEAWLLRASRRMDIKYIEEHTETGESWAVGHLRDSHRFVRVLLLPPILLPKGLEGK